MGHKESVDLIKAAIREKDVQEVTTLWKTVKDLQQEITDMDDTILERIEKNEDEESYQVEYRAISEYKLETRRCEKAYETFLQTLDNVEKEEIKREKKH